MPILLFTIFLILPLTELYILIQVGSQIGALTTIALSVFTAAAGVMLLRRQGLSVLEEAQRQAREGTPPVASMIHGVFLALAGVFLLTPGFLTDCVGFLLLIPPVRVFVGRMGLRFLRERMVTIHPPTRLD